MKIRDAIVALPGYKIVEIDYSQLETYCLAALTHDEILLQELFEAKDIHLANAALWKKVPESEIKPKVRKAAKALTFGLAYGETAFGMERSKGIAKDEGQAFIDAFYNKYKSVDSYHNGLQFQAESHGYPAKEKIDEYPIKEYTMEMQYGKRYVFRQELRTDKRGQIHTNFKPTYLKNYPVQGIASDIIRFALAKLWRDRKRLFTGRGYLMNTIHDSILLMVKCACLELVKEVEEIMAKEPIARLKSLGFPWPEGLELVVESEIGDVWSEMEGLQQAV